MNEALKAKRSSFKHWLSCPLALIALMSVVDIIRYLALDNLLQVGILLVIELFMVWASVLAVETRLPALHLLVAIPAFLLGFFTNYAETTMFNMGFYVQFAVAAFTVVGGTIWQIVKAKKQRVEPIRKPSLEMLLPGVVLCVLALGTWGMGTQLAAHQQGHASRNIWSVPDTFDAVESTQPGTVEEVVYQTKAYATDERDVEKRAYVYLPYGYDESKSYNVLYLLHGTGDDEAYWLVRNQQNKIMLDRMIELGEIEPLIVVTPTWYVEDDCKGNLDPLTYSFCKELQNDLMPAIESKYATYATTADTEGFADSRDHRAFAGLSRGAVTTYRSVLCESLQFFSWYGMFSGSRTDGAYIADHIQTEELKDLPIHYLYVSSGSFDFALSQQLKDYRSLLNAESRLEAGVNTTFDLFPVRYHSMGNWHLALYNCLQHMFTNGRDCP